MELKVLDLRLNELIELDQEICHLTTLEKLDLGVNRLMDLPDSLCLLQGTMIDLGDNPLSDMPEVFESTVQVLEFLKKRYHKKQKQ
jgi:Leucine-rich repeat (LRR) protein